MTASQPRPAVFRLTAPPAIKLNERQVIRQCADFLQLRGYWLQRNPVGKFKTMRDTPVYFGPTGIPDYIAVHAKFPAFFLETKATGRNLRPTQVSKFAEIQFGYGLAAVAVDGIEDLIVWLDGYEARVQAAWARP